MRSGSCKSKREKTKGSEKASASCRFKGLQPVHMVLCRSHVKVFGKEKAV